MHPSTKENGAYKNHHFSMYFLICSTTNLFFFTSWITSFISAPRYTQNLSIYRSCLYII